MVHIEQNQNNTARESKKKLPVCLVNELKAGSMLKGVSVLGDFTRNGLNLRITSASGQAVLKFSSNAINRILTSGVGSEFHGHRNTGYILSSHPAVVGNLFRDLRIVVTPECVQVLQTRLGDHTQSFQPSVSPESTTHLQAPIAHVNPHAQTPNVDKTLSSNNRLDFKVRSTLLRDRALGKTA